MPDYDNNDMPDNGEELPEIIEPVVMDDEFRGFRHSQIDCRCCGCSGSVVLFILAILAGLAIYHIFFRS